MKAFMKATATMMLIAVVMMSAGCTKPDDPNNPNSGGNGGNGGGSSATTEGIYLGVIGFNRNLYTKEIKLLNSSSESEFTNFIENLRADNLTGLYYADYQALEKLNSYAEPPKLKNVALVTFTDGLDNYSLNDSETNPESYGSKLAYRVGLHNKIVSEPIYGKSVAAYTIGLKGDDVNDEAEFQDNLNKLASVNSNAFQVSNMRSSKGSSRLPTACIPPRPQSMSNWMSLPDTMKVHRFVSPSTSRHREIQSNRRVTYRPSTSGPPTAASWTVSPIEGFLRVSQV